MKRGQLIGIAIAGVCGLGAFVLAKNIVMKPREVTVVTQTKASEVLVARANIGLGQITTESSFRWQSWPENAVPPGAITRRNGAGGNYRDFVGNIARSPILQGEPITKAKLVNAKDGGVLAAILPAGMRAVSVQIRDEHLAAGKMILPNDRVDVILIRRQRGRGGKEEISSETIFSDVRVLAIGQRIEVKEGQKNAEGNTATLEMTPEDAEQLVVSRAKGELTLVLRSIADFKKKDVNPSDKKNAQAPSTVKMLRYGVKSNAYGVN